RPRSLRIPGKCKLGITLRAATAEAPWRGSEQMREHIVRSYQEELALLDRRVAQMGGLAENALGQAFDALEKRDPRLAEAVIASDKAIDRLEREVDDQVV